MIIKDAIVSPCETYRYELRRIWNEPKGIVLYIMLNGSTATATYDDSTIKKLYRISDYNGFGGFVVLNLFGYRATDPAELQKQDDPIGPENDTYLRKWVDTDVPIVIAWGNHGALMDRDQTVLKMLPDNLLCLEINKTGTPKHPLYCKDKTKFISFSH